MVRRRPGLGVLRPEQAPGHLQHLPVQPGRLREVFRLPEPEILSVGLDEGRTRVYDRDFGLLGFRPDDALVEEARGRALEEIEDAARENGILYQAERNAEASIRSFLTALGFERVRFE